MIKYNNSNINDWYFYTSDIIKVYRNGAVVYYKVNTSGETPTFDVCYAVVDDISQYSDREFVDVYDNATDKWYKLNNLNQYEQYGVYGSGRNITYYDGKLTIDDGYEYIYSGSSWVNVGEVSGGTASLPDVSFMLNYNAKDYNASTHSIAKTSGQTRDVDAVCNYGYHIVDHSADGYITVTGNTRMLLSGTPYMGRNNTQTGCTMTIVSKVRTTDGYSILTNRGGTSGSQMNWMWRFPTDGIFLHGSSNYSSKTYSVNTTTNPIIASVRTYYDGGVKQTIKDWTNNGSYSGNFEYGTEYNGNSALFCDYASYNREFWRGDFYWVYMSQNTLTDEQVQQVIAYNEDGGGQTEYPVYYDEKADPLNDLTFNTMEDALDYAYNNCVYDGMKATIAGDRYYFDTEDENGWVESPSRLPIGYTEVEYIENSTSGTNYYIDTQFKPNQDTRVILEAQPSVLNNNPRMFGSGPWNGLAFVGNIENISPQKFYFKYGQTSTWYTTNIQADTNKHTFDLNKNSYYIDGVLANTASTSTFQLTTNLGIFNAPATRLFSNTETFIGKVFSCKIYDNGTLIRDFVPCYRDSDSKSGLYDVVNDVFYSAVNTSYNFTVGNPV